MAEYLAPGVYLEEVDNGAKPIEGVSTSTTGMVGFAERGPADIPILVTSQGEFVRWFGGLLPRQNFTDPVGGVHSYLPHALDGFFTNGGKRAYVVRVASPTAARATTEMFWADPAVINGDSILLRAAPQGSGPVVPLYLLTGLNFNPADAIRIGQGSAAEFRTIAAAGVTAGVTQHIPLNGPLSRAHAAGGAVSEHALAAVAGLPAAKTLAGDAAQGALELLVNSADNLTGFLLGPPPAADQLPWLIQITLDGTTDLPVCTNVEDAGPGVFRLTLNQPIRRAYLAGTAVVINRSAAAGARVLATDAAPGELLVFATINGAGAAVVELDRGGIAHEAFLRGNLFQVSLAQALPFAAPANSRFEHVTLADDGTVTPKATTAALQPGTRVIALNDRQRLTVGQIIRVGAPALEEFATILAIPAGGGPAPDPGTITLAQPLVRNHAAAVVVQAQLAPVFPGGGHNAARLVLAADAGSTGLLLNDGAAWVAGDHARITAPDGDVFFARAVAPIAAAAPATVLLTSGLARTHSTSEQAVEREALFAVQALDVGGWGNRLAISTGAESRPLAETHVNAMALPFQLSVDSLTGLESGSLVELTNPDTGASLLLKVRRTDTAAQALILDPPGLTPAALAGLGPIGNPLELRSREFRLSVTLRRTPDPAVPSRNSLVLASEAFAALSMDHRHSRYFQQVIGATNGPLRLEDNRPEGESSYVRVLDGLLGAATEAIRPGPEALVDLLPGGVVQSARQALEGGDDSIAALNPAASRAAYLGADNADPRLRTGLAALRNIPEVSLIAIPGQTDAALQAGVIAHCEAKRYCFAVLDAASERASISDVRQQRQQFDTRYAALYYPWLTIPDPMPANLANIGDLALPPSGHVLGLIARVDVERGVHKAPANEVVRGITGLARTLQKGEHDILNPSPTNICVVRDFRPDGRGIRLFGARCITSDQEHKYINVRRLLIFLEQSIEQGLQWVVFEPNAEPLWARVTQTITNFLTDVWRGGALEGTEPGQGYFVKCDRTTMTQSDIDNGRLICLVGVAPVKPAEFVIIRIGLTTRTADNA